MSDSSSRQSVESPAPTPGAVTLRDFQCTNAARSARWMAGSPGWTTLEIAGELAGEAGELAIVILDMLAKVSALANVCKKLRRSEMGVPGNKISDEELLKQARGEMADVLIVLALTASKLGVDLEDAVRDTFNAKSEQMGFPERVALAPTAGGELAALQRIDGTLAFFASVIRCGEPFTSDCEQAHARARTALAELRASLLARQRDGARTTEARLRMLATLADDWDGYGARRTHLGTIESARRLAHVLSEPPDIVPTSEGGIQLEWQRGGIEVEIRISPEGDIEPTIDVEVSPPSTERASE